MPTLFIIFGLVFRIFTRDHLPPHVHVLSQDGEAKYQVSEKGVELIENKGLKPKDLRLAESVLEENKELVIQEWVRIHVK